MAEKPDREYVGDGIIVEWYASRCIHSGNCARAIPRVFNPRRKPWIDATASTADRIATAVENCPSGALQYRRSTENAPAPPDSQADQGSM